MKPINNFDVLKRMSERNRAIQLAPKTKRGAQVTIGVSADVLAGLVTNRYVGGLILADKQQFDATKAELEEEAGGG